MKAWLSSFIKTPAFEDDDDRRAAQLLRLVLAVCLLCVIGYGVATALDHDLPWTRHLTWLGVLAVTLACDWGLRRGYVRPQAWVLVVGLTGLALTSQVTSGGVRAPATLTLFVSVVLAGQLLGWGGALIVASIGGAGALTVFWLYESGRVRQDLLHTEAQYARALVIQLLGSGSLIAISAWSLSATLRRLERERAASRALVEQAPDAMVSLDEHGRLIQVNRAHELFAGRSREEMLGTKFDSNGSALDPAALAEARQRYSALMAGQGVPLFRFELQRPDGSRVFGESNARRVTRADGSQGIDLVIRDVTEQVAAERRQQELEQQLRAARKLEAIGQLAGGVAHDFNNLLTVVLGNVQLLRTTALDSDQQESLASIEAAADRAATITRQLLAIGRRQPSRPLALSMNDALAALRSLLRRMVPEHVSITTNLAADLPNIVADPGQLDQVVLNLVANARDAMPDGGQLVIETFATQLQHRDQLPPLAPGRYVTLRVRDSGQGMSQEIRDRVFEPFFTTKSPTLGSGLGLATVYGIVQQQGGHIVVESSPGAGSSFSVYFPASSEAVSGTPALAPPARARRGRLLLVDDDEAVRNVVAAILRRAGHDVAVAAGGGEALQVTADGGGLDLLVTDVVMPGMSGIELSRELRRQRPQLKVLLLSGYPGRSARELSGEPGVEYLAKPVTPELLLSHVDQLLRA